eukprot:11418518-Alexandrium_andersonii.AAC.1
MPESASPSRGTPTPMPAALPRHACRSALAGRGPSTRNQSQGCTGQCHAPPSDSPPPCRVWQNAGATLRRCRPS